MVWGFVRRLFPRAAYRETQKYAHDVFTKEPTSALPDTKEEVMNSIVYIVGLVVIIGVILSYFGFR